MLQLNISDADIQTLNYERFRNSSIIVQKRFHSIYLKSQNLTNLEIARILDIHYNSVTNYIKLYMSGGIQKLQEVNYGTNSSMLDLNIELTQYFSQNSVYSLAHAIDFIYNKTGCLFSRTAVWNYFGRIKVKYRKTGHIPAKADVKKQQDFIRDNLSPIIDKAKKGECTLLFVDAAHFVLGVFLTMLWSLKRIFLPSPAGRQRFNVVGALNVITKKLTVLSNITYVNAEVIADFLRIIAQEYGGKPIYIVLDNARYQHCKYIKELAQELNIELMFLPPYSPNLNLIERLWKFVKKKVLYAKYYDNFMKFQNAIIGCLNDCDKKYKEELNSLLSLKFQSFEKSQIYPE